MTRRKSTLSLYTVYFEVSCVQIITLRECTNMSERKRLRLSENEAAPVPANDGSSGGGVGLQMNQMNHNISEVEATEHPQLGDDGQQRHYTLEEEAEDSHAPPPEGAVVGEVQRHPNGVQPTGNLFLLSREKVELARLQRTEGCVASHWSTSPLQTKRVHTFAPSRTHHASFF